MNKNAILSPEAAKQQVVELINHSGVVPEDFIKELAHMYHMETVENSCTHFHADCKTYYDSFVE
ncbi:hypothetical protein [Crassaminicella profunda]|uniref:hypothetical protein n=1 Tax=Crassaminicella profunda TaxID=1286698 RepID=UPI001CA6C3C2|nr:hypothetical protein [Crassaminicella profunda]QZY56117.1 hypothetical protein K7H06_03695 [Crassaminicella profunda]